jgi:formylglycine-generating enzyme required for sulfatase activity
MAQLLGAPDGPSSCVDEEGALLPVDGSADDDPIPDEMFDSGEDCSDAPGVKGAVCIPAGALLLGDLAAFGEEGAFDSSPERVARVPRFWIDRHEVTVARYRAALANGLERPSGPQLYNNVHPLASSPGQNTDTQCTWNDAPKTREREDHPLSCIDWQSARDFCVHVGGELPTEAQWEHAATSAGRAIEVTHPWGEPEPPDCHRAVFGRFADPTDAAITNQKEKMVDIFTRLSGACREEHGFGPLPVGSADDVTQLGVVDMGGSVSEWVLDAAYPYDHPCWASQPIDNPACSDVEPPLRGVRGGSWAFGAHWITGATRGGARPSQGTRPTTYLGFRCVYHAPPSEETYP